MKKRLKKDVLAEKAANLLILDITLDGNVKNDSLKKNILKIIKDAYIGGYDLATTECQKENSRSGDDMYYYLKDLEDNTEVT